ncbi:uncharacterized protein LOC126965494 [Leptidea sinapis]|uniref:uncharacterized protein LOC126965494 n=1 Tax=Leptidea sinapis TaxID=189913 RepID=UPI0021C442BE|nr:uncharacterized protein LOC126965494 [Leptidea sinapis]
MRERIQNLIVSCLELDSLVVAGSRFYTNLKKYLRKLKLRFLSISTFMLVDGYMFLLRPAVRSGRHFTEDALVVYGLEPMLQTPNFEIATACESTCIFISIYTMVNVISLIFITVGYVEAQLLALRNEILHIWDDTLEYLNNYKNKSQPELAVIRSNFVASRLSTIIQFHIHNIKLVATLDHALRQCKVLEYIIIMAATLTELLGGIENTYLHMPYTWAMVIIDCFTGQKLIDACVAFEHAIYNCKWENFDKRNMLTVLVLLQDTQKMLTLSAGGILVLNYCCILSLYKLCYSMYTTLSIVLK